MGEGEQQTSEDLAVNDIAYIDTLVPHQLKNNSDTPCGFLCLVDRRRDRPRAC